MEDLKIVKKRYYKYCIVPCCTNTTYRTPEKIFFSVPKDELTRKTWSKAMRRDEKKNKKFSTHSTLYCCEDHFSLENDMANYWEHRLSDSCKVHRLKPGVVPSMFECQKKDLPKSLLGKCVVPACKGNYNASKKVAVFRFPTQKCLKEKWLQAIPKEKFKITKNTKVCERHFKVGEVLQSAKKLPKLKKNAVPSIFPYLPTFMTSSSSPLKESPSKKQEKIKTELGAELQNVAETFIVVKEEPMELVDEPPQPVIEKVYCAEELLSSSLSKYNISPVAEDLFPIPIPDTTNLQQIPAKRVSNKTALKRKINIGELDTNDVTLDANQVGLHRHDKPGLSSKVNSNLYPGAGTSKSPTRHFTLPTLNNENATREFFKSLFSDSQNNPFFGSRTVEMPGELFSIFADFIANKLRKMDWDDCAYASRSILDIVLEVDKVYHDDKDENVSSPKNISGSLDKK